jgi:hypothetical protein
LFTITYKKLIQNGLIVVLKMECTEKYNYLKPFTDFSFLFGEEIHKGSQSSNQLPVKNADVTEIGSFVGLLYTFQGIVILNRTNCVQLSDPQEIAIKLNRLCTTIPVKKYICSWKRSYFL